MFLLIAIVLSFSEIPLSFASSQPQIVKVLRTPIKPPPNFGVSVTCSILDKYGLVNVSLHLSINNGAPSIVKMRIVEGDFYNGTFYAQIPPQLNGTWVEYYVIAADSIGYLAQSLSYSYQVSYDKTPPTILKVTRIKPLGSPIQPPEEVEIEASICDDGSGVKNATLFFGVGEDPYYMDFAESPMIKTNGEDYNCTFLGIIPPHPNGSRIWYFVYATDSANNTARPSERYQYFVIEAKHSWLSININVLSVHMSNLTATVNVTLQALLPSENEPNFFNIWVSNGIAGGLVDSPLYVPVTSSFEVQRFFYKKTINWNVHLIGSPNYYPYDSYFLNFTFEVFWSQPNSIRFGGAFFGDYRLRNIWGDSPVDYYYNTTDSYGKPLIITTIILVRDGSNMLPIALSILALFFVLGATMFVEPEGNLNERVTIFLAVLVFALGFFFSLGSIVPYRHGFTIAETLVLSLVAGSAIFTIGSFLSKAIGYEVKNRYVGIIVDSMAILIFFGFLWQFKIFPNSQQPQTSFLASIPAMHGILIGVGICYGLAFRIVITARKELSLIWERINLWVFASTSKEGSNVKQTKFKKLVRKGFEVWVKCFVISVGLFIVIWASEVLHDLLIRQMHSPDLVYGTSIILLLSLVFWVLWIVSRPTMEAVFKMLGMDEKEQQQSEEKPQEIIRNS